MNNDLFDIDLGAAAEEGEALTVFHPTTKETMYFEEAGEKKPIRIFVKGNDSPTFRRRMDFLLRKNGKNESKQASIAEMEEQSSDLLSTVTVGWEGVYWKGVPLECTKENAKMLYLERPWLRRQVDNFVSEAENFFKVKSSS